VYLLMMMADWLQGPYVYALYAAYGFSKGDIGVLFIAGFGSSLVFGTVVGGFADRFGRKANCLLFALLYSVSCMTKHFNNFNALLFGRLTGGISTSILYSAFETWMIHEHKAAGFDDAWISGTFSLMTFGSSVVAILAGLVASGLTANFGLVAPFDASMLLLVAGGAIVFYSWRENYGEAAPRAGGGGGGAPGAPAAPGGAGFALPGFENFGKAAALLQTNRKVLLLGVVQSCFEASMYIFVFMWTLALEATVPDAPLAEELGAAGGAKAAGGPKIPHGLIFAGFMVCIMVGSKLFELLLKAGGAGGAGASPLVAAIAGVTGTTVEGFTRWVFVAAAASLALPIVTANHTAVLIGFSCFELCCGVYFPAAGTLRSRIIPEEVRSTVMNVFRVGLNVLVVLTLLYIDSLANDTVFLLCTVLLTIATWAQHQLFVMSEMNAPPEQRATNGLDVGSEMDAQLASKTDASA